MKTISNILAYITRKVWLAFAVLTVSLALLITVLRYTLPYMDNQKSYIENWLFDSYGAEVDIGYISAIWKARGPAIVLKDVTLVRNESSPIAFSIDETQVELDLISSLQSWQINSKRFNLIGMQMEIDLAELQGGDQGSFPIVDALQTLFLEQLQRFSVSHSEVTIKTELDQQQILVQQLSWLNKGTRHQGVGELKVAELANNSARFVLDLAGTRNDLEGTFYAKGEDLDLAPWVNAFAPVAYDLQESRGNFEFWADLYNSQVTSIQANLSESRFAWQDKTSDTSLETNLIKGQFLARPHRNGWLFNMSELMLMVEDQVLTSHWAGELTKSGLLTLNNLQPINLAPALPITKLLLGTNTAEQILALSPSVIIDDLHVEASAEQHALRLNFSQFNSNETDSIPGLQDVAGSVSLMDGLGYISLRSSNNVLKSGQLLGYNIDYDELLIDAYVNTAPDALSAYVSNFTLAGDMLNIESALAYQFESELLQFIVKVGDVSVTEMKSLFPRNIMGPETTAYLKRNLLAGVATGMEVIWSGQIGDYPFANNEGIFQASVNLRDGQFEFDDEWPVLTELDADLLFENAGLRLFGHHGKLLDVTFQDIVANIPELSEDSALYLSADGSTTGTLATGLMQASSLQSTVGEALDVMHISGPLEYNLGLTVPLSGYNIEAKGEIRLNNNLVALPTLSMQLLQTKGAVEFHNERIVANSMTAKLWGQDLAFSVDGKQHPDAYHADVSLDGGWNLGEVIKDYHPSLEPYFVGDIPWQGNLALKFPKSGFSYSLQLHSQMTGVAVNLPSPFIKSHDEQRLLFVDSEGDETASTIRILMGEDVKFNGIFPHAEGQFSRAHLSVGEDNFVGMGLGFSISAQLSTLPFAPWYDFVDALLADIPDASEPFLAPPQRVFINANTLEFAGQHFQNSSVLAKRQNQDWQVDLHSDEARAKVRLDDGWLHDGMQIDADYVNLVEKVVEQPSPEPQREDFDYSTLPPIRFKCDSCSVYGYELGKVDLVMNRSPIGMSIERVVFAKKQGTMEATGDWFIQGQNSSTLLKGRFSSGDFGAFLKDLDYESGIRDSDAEMTFNISWKDTPFAIESETLNGDIEWHLSDGYLTEISDQGARIFSILSLESLIRKLTLDFRDVFAKGFFYEKMDGTFQIVDGRVATKDTVIDGAAAKVRLEGYTNLADQRLNYTVSVKPNLTSSLPVLLAWMVNPATAVAALALDEVITSANVVSNIKYAVTGTLSEPMVEQLDKASKSVELPAQKQPQQVLPSDETTPSQHELVPAEFPQEPLQYEEPALLENSVNG